MKENLNRDGKTFHESHLILDLSLKKERKSTQVIRGTDLTEWSPPQFAPFLTIFPGEALCLLNCMVL